MISAKAVKVLFAEDEVLVRLMMAEVLRGQGFQVFEASDGEEGISILRAMPVDVVITDLRMDTLTDGLELARYVRAECPGCSANSSPLPRRPRSSETSRSTPSSSSRTRPRTLLPGSDDDTPALPILLIVPRQ